MRRIHLSDLIGKNNSRGANGGRIAGIFREVMDVRQRVQALMKMRGGIQRLAEGDLTSACMYDAPLQY